MLELTLVDYGVGNLHSLTKACERAGATVSVAASDGDLRSARALLLPGVGAFGKVAAMLAPVRDVLRGRLRDGVPALCVCIGMQVLYESSEEDEGEGLGLLPGRVRRLRHERLPHIGWNGVRHRGAPMFESIADGSPFYYVHSFAPSPCGEGVVATSDYGGEFAAAAATANVWAVQFHPEKSSTAGLRLVENFVRFAASRV